LALPIYIGWDPREDDAYRVCVRSLEARASIPVRIQPIVLGRLRSDGLYTRPTEIRDGRLWDVISEAPMSTEFAISRFFAPLLAARDGIDSQWAIFCDCDFLWCADIAQLLGELDTAKALCCVQHQHVPSETVKMDGQLQLRYGRKNWSSLMAFNLRHPSNQKLDRELLNGVPGRDLHRFCWLGDDEIHPLAVDWNWLEGSSAPLGRVPRAIHFTRGGPWLDGWDHVTYADLWRREFAQVQASGSPEKSRRSRRSRGTGAVAR
jgi:hypothetical protein